MQKSKNYTNEVLSGAAVLFVAMGLSKLINAAFKIPLGNILGGVGLGYFTAAFSVLSPVHALFAAWIPTIVTRFTAAQIAEHRYKNIAKIRRIALRIALLTGFFGTIAILVLTTPFALYITDNSDSIPAMLFIAPSIFFCSIASVYKGYCEGIGKMTPTGAANVVESIARAVFGLGGAYFGLSITKSLPYAAAGAVLGTTAAEVVSCGFLFFVTRFVKIKKSNTHYENTEVQPASQILKGMLHYAIPVTAGALASNLGGFIDLITINSAINKSINDNQTFFLENFIYGYGVKSLSEIGAFVYGSYSGIVASVFGLVPSITAMLSRSAAPEITKYYESDNKKGLSSTLRTLFQGTIFISAPMYAGLGVLASPVLKLLYFSRPSEAIICILPLMMLCASGLFLSLGTAAFSVFSAIGKADLIPKIMVGGCTIKLLLNLILIPIPTLNITGAAISTATFFVFVCATALIILKKHIKVHTGILSSFIRFSSCGVACGITAWAVYYILPQYLDFLNSKEIIKLLVAIVAGGLVYLLTAGAILLYLKSKSTKKQAPSF